METQTKTQTKGCIAPSLEGRSPPQAPIKVCASIQGLCSAAYEDQPAERGTAPVHFSQEFGTLQHEQGLQGRQADSSIG